MQTYSRSMMLMLLSCFISFVLTAQKKSTNNKAASQKTVALVPVDEASSRLMDSCAEVFATAINKWSAQMAQRSDLITNYTGCGSADCRRKSFGELNELLSSMSKNVGYGMYTVLYKNDSRLGTCPEFAELVISAKWKLSEGSDQYESAATYAINLKNSYNDYSTDQRGQFIKLMFDAYDRGDVASQDGMKTLMDAYELYIKHQCSNVSPGTALAGGNIIYQALANAQSYLKFKLEASDNKQQKNIAAGEKKKKEAEAAANARKNAGNNSKDASIKATKCKCCKGARYITKQEAVFHKTSEKRVERVKKMVQGKAEIEVTYEPIGYTTYKSVKEKCTCCNGTGIEE